MRQARLTARAQLDLGVIYASSEDRFGERAAQRYRQLVVAGLRALRENPTRQGVRGLTKDGDLKVFHLRHVTLQLGGRRFRPRQVIVFREAEAGLVIVRILHDAMDLPAHLQDI